MAAHLVYLDKTEAMVKRTQSMMAEVLQDERMSITHKIEALHMLAGHLATLQESAKKTLAGMGLDSDDLLDEVKRMKEEEALEQKFHGATAAHAPPSSFLELRSSIEEINEDEDDQANDSADTTSVKKGQQEGLLSVALRDSNAAAADASLALAEGLSKASDDDSNSTNSSENNSANNVKTGMDPVLDERKEIRTGSASSVEGSKEQ